MRLEQVVSNLLTNAMKYTPPGGSVRVEVVRLNDAATIKLVDSGVGIAPEMLVRIFDLFAQVDRSLDRAQGGLGLGELFAMLLTGLGYEVRRAPDEAYREECGREFDGFHVPARRRRRDGMTHVRAASFVAR